MSLASALSTTISSSSNTTLLMSGIIVTLLAVFGYRLSQRSRATRGVTPWRIPSVVWALISILFGPFGFALELIAIASTRSTAAKAGTPRTVTAPSVPVAAAPTTTAEVIESYVPRIPASGLPGPASDEIGKPALFGWYADPSERHELRYWDGRDWTAYVADGDLHSTDPLERS